MEQLEGGLELKALLWFLLFIFTFSNCQIGYATTNVQDEEAINARRIELYKKAEAFTQIPWFYFAGIDQYERSARRGRKDIPREQGTLSIYFEQGKWAGPLNPQPEDTNPATIRLFGGYGKDGDGDGKASVHNDEDVIMSIAHYLQSFGTSHEHIKMALWNYYRRAKAVDIIVGNAKLFEKYNRLNLHDKVFPVLLRSNYSYKNTWGDARGWGGRRIHEGTDIFAGYGVPVRSTCYGIIELKGWNRYGGWRIGIRDLNNVYHYFAHLSGFAKDLKVGQIVEPGMLIGGVGSSGYGPPGTSGKFPPHLHYGMYKDNGVTEWSFDPYPQLKMWERAERAKLRQKK